MGIHSIGREALSKGGRVLSSDVTVNPKLTRIKEEWEPEEVSAHGVRMGGRSIFPGQVSGEWGRRESGPSE